MLRTKSFYTKASYDINQTIQWKMLSDDQAEEIVMAAFELLERTGAEIESPKAAEIFKKGGCWVKGSRVRIPSSKLEWALRTAPSRVTLCDRDGQRAILMETDNAHYGPGFGNAMTMDVKTGEIRKTKKEDVANISKICQGLQYIDFLMNNGKPGDVPEKTAELHAFEALVSNSKKPIVQEVSGPAQAAAIIEMAAAVAGGAEELRQNPFLAIYVENREALALNGEALETVILAAESGVPVVWNNVLFTGLTAPKSNTGALIVALANALTVTVLAQLAAEGAPVILGGFFSINDEENQVQPYGAPETSLIGAGFSNVLRYLRLPSFGYAGGCDAKISDAQMGLEAAFSTLHMGLSGTNLIFGAGQMESGAYSNPHLVVLADELVGMTRRIMRGLVVDEDHLARGVIDDVQPGGHYLGSPHTLYYFKEEQFWPQLMNRKRLDDWIAAGSKTLGTKAAEKAIDLLTYAEPVPLAAEIAAKLQAIIAKAEGN